MSDDTTLNTYIAQCGNVNYLRLALNILAEQNQRMRKAYPLFGTWHKEDSWECLCEDRKHYIVGDPGSCPYCGAVPPREPMPAAEIATEAPHELDYLYAGAATQPGDASLVVAMREGALLTALTEVRSWLAGQIRFRGDRLTDRSLCELMQKQIEKIDTALNTTTNAPSEPPRKEL